MEGLVQMKGQTISNGWLEELLGDDAQGAHRAHPRDMPSNDLDALRRLLAEHGAELAQLDVCHRELQAALATRDAALAAANARYAEAARELDALREELRELRQLHVDDRDPRDGDQASSA